MIEPVTATLIVGYTGQILSSLLKLLIDNTVPGSTITDFFKKKPKRKQELVNLLLTVEKVLGDAEEKQITNHLVRKWVDNLRDVAYDAEDLLDAIITNEMCSQQTADHYYKPLQEVLEKLKPIVDQIRILGLKGGHSTGRLFPRLPTTSLVDKSYAECLRTNEIEKILPFLTNNVSYFTGKQIPVVSIVGLSGIGKTTLAQFLYNDEKVQNHFDLRLWVYVSQEFDVFKVTKTIYESATLGRRKSVHNQGLDNVRYSGRLRKRKRQSDDKEGLDVQSADKEDMDVDLATRNHMDTDVQLHSTASARHNFDREDMMDLQSAAPAPLWHSGVEDLDVLQVILQRKLTGKKFLLVLDNVWNVGSRQWDLLCKPFQIQPQLGSKIIVTTCNRNVSSTIRSELVHDMEPLSTSLCEILFEKQAFGDKEGDPILKKMGKDIVRKCGGFPLAAKTLGGLLHSKKEAEEWENILNTKIWDLRADDKGDILPGLRSSYHYLPSQLKPCFAYCSIFPKGHKFKKLDLVRMWIAQGLVEQPNNGRLTLEVGLRYFDELISMSIFQQCDKDQPHFTMPDLVYDLAQHIAGGFYFKLEDHDSPSPLSLTDAARVRHLSCKLKPSTDNSDYYDDHIFKPFYGSNKAGLRTFLTFRPPTDGDGDGRTPFSSTVFDNLFPESSCVRVLCLSSYRGGINKCPDSVGKLKQLRYLDLSGTDIPSLPKKTSLYNLETLKLSYCRLLTHLPPELSNLTKLEHLDIKGTKVQHMPPEFGKLKRIQLLTDFVVGKDENCGISCSCISEIKDLCLLRTLSIVQLQNVKNIAGEAILKHKKYLRELILEWGTTTTLQSDTNVQNKKKNLKKRKREQSAEKLLPGKNLELEKVEPEPERSADEVLEKLQPGENLEKLELKNFCGMNFPTWLGNVSFTRMKFLSLENCQNCRSLPPLGQLPSLKQLTIQDLPALTTLCSKFYGTGNEVFKSLETLKFVKMHNWVQWSHLLQNQTGFESLRQLFLVQCDKLTDNHIPEQIPTSKVIRRS